MVVSKRFGVRRVTRWSSTLEFSGNFVFWTKFWTKLSSKETSVSVEFIWMEVWTLKCALVGQIFWRICIVGHLIKFLYACAIYQMILRTFSLISLNKLPSCSFSRKSFSVLYSIWNFFWKSSTIHVSNRTYLKSSLISSILGCNILAKYL